MPTQNIVAQVRAGNLTKHWERNYSVFFLSSLVPAHAIGNRAGLGEGSMTLALFTYRNGLSSYYRLAAENEKFLTIVGDKLMRDAGLRGRIFRAYAAVGDSLRALYGRIHGGEQASTGLIRSFSETIGQLVGYQLIMHRVIDSVARVAGQERLVSDLTRLRTKYEDVFGSFEDVFGVVCVSAAAGRTISAPADLQLLTPMEFLGFLDGAPVPSNLAERRQLTVVSVIPSLELFVGKPAQELADAIERNIDEQEHGLVRANLVKGHVVSGSGTLRGTVQRIPMFADLEQLEPGKILVAPSTIPKYNHLYHRAKAIITDEGGLLGHPAILCREYNIAGIVGTRVASKVFKTGDEVEVNFVTGEISHVRGAGESH